MQNISILQAQVESLKEMIEIMERTTPDSLVKMWRSKVFEELVRNKQQQIMHAMEIKKFKEEEKKYRSREQQIKAALESAHLQSSSLTLERAKLLKEIQILQGKVRNQSIHSSFILSLQSTLTSNLEGHAKIIAMLDTYNHRIAFSMSKIKTAKILHTREIFSLRNKLSEEITEQKRLKEEVQKGKGLEVVQEKLENDKERMSREIEELTLRFEVVKSQAEGILKETCDKYQKCVNELESQLDEKVSENNVLLQKLDNSVKEMQKLQALMENFQSQLDISTAQNLFLTQSQAELIEKCSLLSLTMEEKDKSLKVLENHKESLNADKQELQFQYKENIEKHENHIKNLEGKISELQKNVEDQLRQHDEETYELSNEIEFLKNKNNKLESSVREIRRERDILFESIKKQGNKGQKEEKGIQTDAVLKQGIFKKAIAPSYSERNSIGKALEFQSGAKNRNEDLDI
ncbi:hypothetical protein SteCoe_37906 [Stentor coeruleus]|uniref:Uncharacterized protein n=1 Tax=Stentor coeruleus TaxID=5963 RepID=A0A1R2AM52_9CILI|nr:hypothetical protein SteCoe_37906 [Stentor coeruleus]